MKHSKQVLILFLILFLLSQILGLSLVTINSETITVIDEEKQEEITKIIFENTTVGERPEIEGTQTLISIGIGIFIGTIILLLLAKFNKTNLWKHWFFFAVTITISVSLGVLFNNNLLAWLTAIIVAAWKIYKPNFWIHNLTELFIYPGIAILLVPILNVFNAFILLIIISIYDAYAVWKSKHMITMAKFAKKSNLFPGLAIAYNTNSGKIKSEKKQNSKKNTKKQKNKTRTGILGGGDIAFPMIFAATFLVFLLEQGYSNIVAMSYAFIISAFAGISLVMLFLYGKKDSYYPAMPFISAGCFVGYLIAILLLNMF